MYYFEKTIELQFYEKTIFKISILFSIKKDANSLMYNFELMIGCDDRGIYYNCDYLERLLLDVHKRIIANRNCSEFTNRIDLLHELLMGFHDIKESESFGGYSCFDLAEFEYEINYVINSFRVNFQSEYAEFESEFPEFVKYFPTSVLPEAIKEIRLKLSNRFGKVKC